MKRSLFCLAILASLATFARSDDFKLKDGDRVLFYGDSITEQHLYTNFIETFIITRYPTLKISFRNTGVGGDSVGGGWAGKIDVRLKRDFADYSPTVATIMLGMNDAAYQQFKDGIFANYVNGYTNIVSELKKKLPNCRVFLIQPSPFDDFAHTPAWEGGYNGVLVRYGAFVKELAKKNGYECIDFNAPVAAALTRAMATDSTLAPKLIADRVHPGEQAQVLMASEALKAWKASGIVSSTEIDLGAKKVVNAVKTKVKLGQGLTWTQLDESLPFPLKMEDPLLALAMKSSDFIEKLNQQVLKVKGLGTGDYTLKIDGAPVGNFSSTDLAAGINLAILKTPMVAQAQQVHEITNSHNQLFIMKWREIGMWRGNYANTTKVADAMELLEQDQVNAQRNIAKPVEHKFELVKKKDQLVPRAPLPVVHSSFLYQYCRGKRYFAGSISGNDLCGSD